MEKTAKVISIILGFVAVVLLVIYIVLCGVNKSIPKDLEYPESGLSQSIFDSQNVKYTPNDNYKTSYSFVHCPYQVDLPEVDSARVGEFGKVYEVSDSMYFYMTEYSSDTSIESVLRSELSPAVMVDSNSEMTAIDNFVYDEGYFNGFKADYYIDGMTVTNGTRTVSVYITGYALTITDNDYNHGYKMFIGCMASGNTTETFAQAKGIVDSVVATYRINDGTQRTLAEQEEWQRAEEERLRQEAESNGTVYNEPQSNPAQNESVIVSTDNSTTDFASTADASNTGIQSNTTQPQQPQDYPYIKDDAIINNGTDNNSGAAAGASIPNRKIKNMTLSEEYTSVTLYYYYTNKTNEISLTLTSPDGQQSYTPTSIADGTAIFKVDRMMPGKWTIIIQGDAGTDSMKLYSENTSD